MSISGADTARALYSVGLNGVYTSGRHDAAGCTVQRVVHRVDAALQSVHSDRVLYASWSRVALA